MSEVQFPYFVDWAITSKCNLSCRHCRGMLTGEISTGRAKELITEIAELKSKWVIIEGGEPLLRDDLLELLSLMRQKQLEVHLITNGMLLNHELIATFKRLGIKVMISIDGATPKTYEEIRSGASFEKVLRAARDCAEEGLLEAINFTIMKRNYTEIPGILKLAAAIGVRQVTFIGLKSCQDYHEEIPSPEEYAEAIKLACQAALDTGVEFFFDEPFFWAAVKEWNLPARLPAESTGILLPSTAACIFGEYLFIEPNGEVKPCSFAPMVLGNVREKSLVQIWNEMLSSPLINQLKDPKTRSGYCLSCRYLPDCKGCRSRTFVLTDDWFASDPSCPVRSKPAVKEDS